MMQVDKGSRILTSKLRHQSALKQPELLAEKPSLFSSSDLELQEPLVEEPYLVDPLLIAGPLGKTHIKKGFFLWSDH